MKPDSSTTTRWALSRAAFRLLATEAQVVQQARDMAATKLGVTVLLDQSGDASRGLKFRVKAVR